MTLKKLNNVVLFTDDNGQEYLRICKNKWMLFGGDDEISLGIQLLEEKYEEANRLLKLSENVAKIKNKGNKQ